MADTRGSVWLRWPDGDGPLWVGMHWNERADEAALVGVEVWTEAPGDARRSLGPPGDPTDDLLPWPPVPVRAEDVTGLRLERLGSALRASLSAAEDSPLVVEALAALGPQRAGRPRLYDDAHYARVTTVYLRAKAAGEYPTKAVAEAWSVSRSAAKKWVMRARQLGLLAQTCT